MTHPHMSTQSCWWDSAVFTAVFTAKIFIPFFRRSSIYPRNKSTTMVDSSRESRLTRYKRSPEISPNCATGGSGEGNDFTFDQNEQNFATKTWIYLDLIYCIGGKQRYGFNQHHISWKELRISSKVSTVFLENMVENPYIVLCFLSENVGTTQMHCLHHHFPVERC